MALAALSLLAAHDAAAQQDRNIRFDRVSIAQGLSVSAVNCIFQDSHGFMWFGTEDGLNRYDGQTFTVFKHDPFEPASLSNSWVWSIHEDKEGNLWIGTDGGGLSRWNPRDGSFDAFKNEPANPSSLSNDRVRVIYESRDGSLWIGTDGGGLNRFDRDARTFSRFIHNPSDPGSLSNDRIRAVLEGEDGALWIGTFGGGLNRLDPSTRTMTHYRHDPGDPASLSDDRVRALGQDAGGALWVGTQEGGVNVLRPGQSRFARHQLDLGRPGSLGGNLVEAVFRDDAGVLWLGTDSGLDEWNPKTGSFLHYRNNPLDARSLSDDRVSSIYQDAGGVVWVGTGGGLNKWNPRTGSFPHFKHDPASPSSLNGNVVSAFYDDGPGTLWIGTFGWGLNRFDRDAGTFTHYVHDPADPRSLSDDRVMCLLVDRKGTLWVGTRAGGLNRLAEPGGGFRRFQHDPDRPASLSTDEIMSLFEDRNGVLWIGTYEGGLDRFDRKQETFIHYRHDPANPTSLSNDTVSCFEEDASGTLWVGTFFGGLNRFDRSTGTFAHYRFEPQDSTSLGSDTVTSIHEDEDGVLWIGTQGGGLNRWEPAQRDAHRGVFRRYTDRDGLPNNIVYGILSDGAGNLWLSTNEGLSKFNPKTETFRNYDTTHGLQSNEFNFGAYHRSSRGEMFFGGGNGFNAFYPDQIRDNQHVPPVVLTGFLKFNQPVALDRPIWEASEIELSYRDYVVSFEFAALDYTAPEQNQYAYKLEGFDQDWIELGTLRRATYTNLDAGKYVLRVKGSNNDGVWNENGVALQVRVIPPPWRTWWAYSVYALLLAGVVYAYTGAQARKLEREAEYSRKLEQEVQERTRELQEASLTDSLTGLRNRRYLTTHIQEDIAQVDRHYAEKKAHPERAVFAAPDFVFLMIDLDGLKALNDMHGHSAGDRAIVQMRSLLEAAGRKTDTLIRWGGDEFLMVGRKVDRHSAEAVAERIRHTVEEHEFDLGEGRTTRLTCSIGFAFYPFLPATPTALNGDQVLAIADRALYLAKTSGRNAWVGIHSTGKTPSEGLVGLINADLEALERAGAVEVIASIREPRALVWGRN
jgi:diguanylate cyclase (GGDEF)-like protein